MRKLIVSAAAICVVACTSVSTAVAEDGPHDKAIKARQAMFQLYSFSSGILGAMAKGKMDYNAELAAEMAANLDAAANLGQSAFWPAGSDNSNPDNARTRALPAIWDDFAGVQERAGALQKATADLAANAGNGLDALKGSMGAVGQACKGCHDDYRAARR